jgi:hypothetical protein
MPVTPSQSSEIDAKVASTPHQNWHRRSHRARDARKSLLGERDGAMSLTFSLLVSVTLAAKGDQLVGRGSTLAAG